MVYSIKDIKHLETMKTLADKQPMEPDVKTLMSLNVVGDASFEENVLKLCNSLRTKGFLRYAEELETKFLLFKQADVHLYRAHDEDGEDIIDAAHPDGDVNMGDGELGDVETIVSKHKKIVDVLEKTPTGKLASCINHCKIVLGQVSKPISYEEAIESYRTNAVALKDKINSIITSAGDLKWYGSRNGYEIAMKELSQQLDAHPIGLANIDNSREALDNVFAAITGKKNFLGQAIGTLGAAIAGPFAAALGLIPIGGVSEEIKSKIMEAFTALQNTLTKMRALSIKIIDKTSKVPDQINSQIQDTPELLLEPEQQQQKVSELMVMVNDLKSKYQSKAASMKLMPAQQKPVLAWFMAQEKEIGEIRTQKDYDARLNELNQFASQLQ